MNNITIKGRLCADPELRETNGGVVLCNFTVAVDRAHNREETDFSAAPHGEKRPNLSNSILPRGRKFC